VQEAKKPKLDPLLTGVVDAIRQAEGLTEACRSMLTAGVPGCFATPADERHEHQAMMISWISRIMDGVKSKLQEAVDTADADEAVADEKKKELEVKVEEAKAALSAEGEAVTAKEASLKEASDAAAAAKTELREREAAQRQAGAGVEKAAKEKAALDNVLEQDVAFLKKEEGFDPKEAAKHMKTLVPIAKRMGIDESLMVALQPAAAKLPAERGAFDNMVLGELEGAIQKKADELGEQLKAAEPAREEQAAAVSAAKSSLEAAEETRTAAATALTTAQAQQSQAADALKDAESALQAFTKERKTAVTAREEKAAALQNFIGYNVECFQMLCNKAAPGGA